MTLEEAIKHCEEVAEAEEQKYKEWKGDYSHLKKIDSCLECANEHRQLAEWLKELKVYKDLSTYNRENKCCECEYEDSEYFCDDCIWNFVDKFKQREVNADEVSD